MKHKIIGKLIQEIIERMMVLGMTTQKTDDPYYLGRIQGLEDALDILRGSLGSARNE